MAQVAEDEKLTREASGTLARSKSGSQENIYLLSFGFNQDYSCFVCGTTAGFRVYTVSPVHEVRRREHTAAFERGSVALVAMLFKTNIFAMVTINHDDVSAGGLNKVQIWDEHKGKFVGELRSRNEVKGVALRRDIIVMVCEYAIYVYTCDQLKVILHLTTNANTRGLCCLAVASDPWILCCPGQSTGAVRVQVGQDDQSTHVFQAHKTALAALALTASGSLLATASEQGTVVKVFQTSDGQPLFRLRRSTRPASISCLTFRADDSFLAVASSSATVHIFKLDNSTAREGYEDNSAASPPLRPAPDPQLPSSSEPRAPIKRMASDIQKAVTTVASRAAAEYFNDLRSIAQFRIPDIDSNGQPSVDVRSKQSKIVGPQLSFHQNEPKLFVLHYSGVLYECSFQPDCDPSLGAQDCGFVCATTWFATRPDFKVQGECTEVTTVAGGAMDGDQEAEEWQLL
ncbi:unnamed protein product [Polarella glacialis]|uniref:WD repeat domain phosphoinositide-interacting protein 2 n=1 Tax=Polarella glacialis TaxID=89957 RepID=A0A813GSH5_POLGL|nr:unnamed protein product [Polarella glacialis]